MSKSQFKQCILLTMLIVSSLLATPVHAQSSVWKVSKNNEHIYIGGTVHILPLSEFPLPNEFLLAYQQSDAIVLEAKLPEPTDLNFQAMMLEKMSYQQGKKLSDVLSKQTYAQLANYLSGLGANLAVLNTFKPGFIVSMMTMMEAKKSQVSGEGVDAYFNQLALKDNKRIDYLESADFQLNMLASMGVGHEDKFINSNLRQMKSFKSMFNKLLSAWRVGDVTALETVVISPMQDDKKSFKRLISDRNKNWITHIEKMFTDHDREFVLVGVGHLIGRENVLSLLKAKGYQVTQLKV